LVRAFRHPTYEQALDASTAGDATTQQPRRKHARIVQHEHITRIQQIGKVGNRPMLNLACCAIHAEQPGSIPLCTRLLRDQLDGKLEVELLNVHLWE
jgi:hypothetical protein